MCGFVCVRRLECRFHILPDNEIKDVPSEGGIPAIPLPAADLRRSDTEGRRGAGLRLRRSTVCSLDVAATRQSVKRSKCTWWNFILGIPIVFLERTKMNINLGLNGIPLEINQNSTQPHYVITI